MCGRYVSVSSPEQLSEQFEVEHVAVEGLERRYNVAPTTQVPVVVDRGGRRTLDTMRWGLVPFWADEVGKGPQPINARIETIDDKRMFARAFRRRRVLLPADGFYEWQRRAGSERKQPWYIHDPQDRARGLAGLWGTWTDEESGDTVESTCILTRDAAGRMADLHHRMPVVLPRNLWATWLEADEKEAPYLHEVITNAGVPELAARTITDRVNNVRNEGPELLEAGSVGD